MQHSVTVLTVRFIDYGNTEKKTLKEIFRWKFFQMVNWIPFHDVLNLPG